MRLARALPFSVALAATCLLAQGCATYRDQLVRSQAAFEQNEYERTLALLRDLEPDVRHLEPSEQAQYAYLRGMTDYRVGYRADARHWLAIATAYEEQKPGVLPVDWKKRSGEALEELNDAVYEGGASALLKPAQPRGEDTARPGPAAPAKSEKP